MTSVTTNPPAVSSVPSKETLEFLNAYEVIGLERLRRTVSTYRVEIRYPASRDAQSHQEAKQAVWDAKKMHRGSCSGRGFVIPVDEYTVAVPSEWQFPTPIETDDYRLIEDRTWTINPEDQEDATIVAGLIQESVKAHFKSNESPVLGRCWQDFGDFCQMPRATDGEYCFCRKFVVTPKRVAGGRWVLQFRIATAAVDSWTLDRYFMRGDGESLSSRLESLASQRLDRSGNPAAVRVWWDQSTPGAAKAEVVELYRPDELLSMTAASAQEQPALAGRTVRVKAFGKPAVDAPLSKLRLLVDTRLTQEEHTQTIIDPLERAELTAELRHFLDGLAFEGGELRLADMPLEVGEFKSITIAPQPLYVPGRGGRVELLPAGSHDENGLQQRARQRWTMIRKNGFLEQQRMSPLLACPAEIYPPDRIEQLKRQLNGLPWAQEAGIIFERTLRYRQPEDVMRAIIDDGCDAALIVLPESRHAAFRENGTHDRLKKLLDVPSQCICHDNTLPYAVSRKPLQLRERRDNDIATRSARTLDVCLTNLITKFSGIPFAPATAHAFNTHVGIDVGGRLNDTVMVCLGTGYADPERGLFYRPDEIRLRGNRHEPIPVQPLARGLIETFGHVYKAMSEHDTSFSFGHTLFFKDGVLRNDSDGCNEADAIRQLHRHGLTNGWTQESDVWAACEVSKLSEGWRMFRQNRGIHNPLVGRAVYCFDNPNEVLVFTTGAPFVTQGTASPLKLKVVPIAGNVVPDLVVQDTVWEADLAFTKPDVVQALPWVLRVADAGALQLARDYRLTGITA